jgi:hypothetical protein
MKLLLSVLAVLGLAMPSASAQTIFRLGVRGGLNRALTTVASASNFTGTYPYSYSAEKNALYAWQAGLVLETSFNKLALQSGLIFSQKGEKFTTSFNSSGVAGSEALVSSTTNRYNWLELPLNVVYTLHGDHGLQIFAGPYLAMAMGGRQRGSVAQVTYYAPGYEPASGPATDVNEQITYGPNSNNRRFDAGLNFGLGYRQGPVQIQAGFGLGVINLHHDNSGLAPGSSPLASHNFYKDAAYNRVAQLTGTYFFSL